MGVTKIIPEPARAAWKVVEVSRRSWIIGEGNGTLWSLVEDQRSRVKGHGSLGKVTAPCGAWWRIKEARRKSYDMSGRNLGRK